MDKNIIERSQRERVKDGMVCRDCLVGIETKMYLLNFYRFSVLRTGFLLVTVIL